MSKYFVFLALACVTGFTCLTAVAQQKKVVVVDPTKTGPDYAVQGEYVGTLPDLGKLGIQVIALGDGKFRGVVTMGGLPGEGWKRGDKIEIVEGTRQGDVTTLKDPDDPVVVTIKNGEATITRKEEVVGVIKRVVRKSSTLGAKPPKGATVLFDGKSADKFVKGEVVMKDLLRHDCESKQKFGDHSLHLEFRTPFLPHARGQGRGNSGMYIQGRYEVQVLDSFGLEGKNNECGGIYSISEPKVNMCFPPLTWQTYDYEFTAAVYEGGKKTKNARVTIRHNGVVIHDNLELPKGTPGKHPEADSPGLLYLQGHGNPVVYRNIWVVEKK
ncbi:MAG: DUF1080 domain-containing protein [Pirellulaceae bacterium]